MNMAQRAHVSEEKRKLVRHMQKLLLEYPLIASINMENLPAQQLQSMRKQLQGKAVLLVAKKRLMHIAISAIKDKKRGIEKIEEHFVGMPGLLFSRQNPFALYKFLKRNKTSAAAKAGQVAPADIVIRAGPTGFAPGPIIGELGSVGLKTGVEKGKVAIKEDKTVVKKGDVISEKLAAILSRLDIKPMEIGLNLVAAFENGDILKRDILDINEEAFMEQLSDAASWALSLSVEAGYMSKDNAAIVLAKAQRDAVAVALEAALYAPDVMKQLINRAESEMQSLKTAAKC